MIYVPTSQTALRRITRKLQGHKVRIYRNLKHGPDAPALYSIVHGGRVVANVPFVALKDVKFIVRESGRQRVIETGRKNVHAFAEGTLMGRKPNNFDTDLNIKTVTYDPYTTPTFVTKGVCSASGGPVETAQAVVVDSNGIKARI